MRIYQKQVEITSLAQHIDYKIHSAFILIQSFTILMGTKRHRVWYYTVFEF
jgi:hypothetical protein